MAITVRLIMVIITLIVIQGRMLQKSMKNMCIVVGSMRKHQQRKQRQEEEE